MKKIEPERPLGAEIWSSEKVDLGGSESACSTALFVDQSSSDFFSVNAGGIAVDHGGQKQRARQARGLGIAVSSSVWSGAKPQPPKVSMFLCSQLTSHSVVNRVCATFTHVIVSF